MGALSSSISCFSCNKSSSDQLSNGWKLHTGGFAKLCGTCYSIYKAGQFCEMFHSDKDGWMDCESCKQLMHCGCIVSLGDYTINDSGGITCNDCSTTKSLLVQDCSNDDSHSTDVSDLVNDTNPIPLLIPLFEKVVTNTDSNASRLIIPKKYALAHFPKVSGSKVVPLNIIDTEGQECDFSLRCWHHPNTTTYVMTGLKEFYISNNLQAGDIVAFYQREFDGKIIMKFRRT